MTDKRRTRLASVGKMIQLWEEEEDAGVSAALLENIVWNMAILLKHYCNQQGKNCDACKFRAEVPEERQCGCKINIGKNECGTAPRFWEVK